MNLWIPLWITTVRGRCSWLECDHLRRTNIMRKIQFFPTFIQPNSNEIFPLCLFHVRSYCKKSFYSYHVWSESKSTDKKKKANSKETHCSAEAFIEPLSEAALNCGFPVQNMDTVEQTQPPQRLEIIWPSEEIAWVIETFSTLPSLNLPLILAHPISLWTKLCSLLEAF